MSDIPLTPEQEMREIAASKQYADYCLQYSNESLRFKLLPEKIKLLSYYLMLKGEFEKLTKAIPDEIFTSVPLGIEEFLAGPAAEISSTLRYAWRKEILDYFTPGKPFSEVVFTGAAGTGKSTCANYMMLFVLYRVCLLRKPQAVFGIASEAPIFFMFLNATLEMAKDINLVPFVNVLANCGAFYRAKSAQDLQKYNGDKIPFHYVDSDAVIRLRNNITVTVGSNLSHIIGKNILACINDEGNLNAADGLKIYSEVGMRIESRFKSSSFTFKALISSSTTDDSVVAEYLDSVEKYVGKSIKLCTYSRWEVFTADPYANGYFFCLGGSSVYPSRVLDTLEEGEMYLRGDLDLPPMCEIIKIPIEHKALFEQDCEKMLQDIVGRATQTAEVPFPDLNRLEDSSLPKLINMSCSINKVRDLIHDIPKNVYRESYDGRKFLVRNPKEPRFIAIDKSLNSGSESAICVLHKERHPEDDSILYVVDMLISISTPDKIDLEQLDNLIIDMIYEFNIPVDTLILDQWNNQATKQKFERLNVAKNVIIHSTSRTIIPIRILSNLVAQDRIKVGKCKKLKDQMKNISLKKMRDGRISYKFTKKQAIFDLFEVLLNAVYAADSASYVFPVSTYQINDNGKTLSKPLEIIEHNKDDILARFGLKIKG